MPQRRATNKVSPLTACILPFRTFCLLGIFWGIKHRGKSKTKHREVLLTRSQRSEFRKTEAIEGGKPDAQRRENYTDL